MGFAGNLNTLSLVEVFQTINRIRATGVLRLAAAESGRDVVFADGEIIGVAFRAGEEKLSLVRRLILEGHLDANTAAAISASQQDSGKVLEGLIQQGKVAEAEVIAGYQRQAMDELYNLCSWEFADFVFQDAGSEDVATQQQVETCKARPLQINVNSLLMEAARRMDEWANLRKVIKSEDAVLGPADGREQDLLAASQGYPGAAVVPLIDAVRTVEAIVAESVATRMDVYGVLAELITDGCVALLDRDDILAHADYQFSQRDYVKAAQLFRRALSENPADEATTAKLADCLQLLGETPVAANCFGQLALGFLDHGEGDKAISAAHRAVRLDSDDPQLRLTLVRCLLDVGKNAEAITELRWIVGRFQELGQFEDARGTCLKILELDPTNEDTRRDMARIFASAERDKDSEDVVVCVQCGHVNHREAKDCAECEAPLRLSCQSCGRIVGVSDRLCIFCGANPHVAGTKRKLLASPTTTRIVNKGAKQAASKDGKGSQFWANKLESSVKQARALEASGDFSGALAAWREIAKINPDNKELQTHIRELEGRVNDDAAEKLIERGHQLRRVRRFLAAMKAYQAAIRAIPESDPRVPRLQEILTSTKKHHQRIMVIYAAAFIAIGVFGWLVARPYLLLHRFRGDLDAVTRLMASVPPGTSPATFEGLNHVVEESDKLDEQAKRLGNSSSAVEGRISYNEFQGQLVTRRAAVADAALKEISTAVGNGDAVRAEQLLGLLRQPNFSDLVGTRMKAAETEVAAARQRLANIEQQRKQAPERLTELNAMEQSGNLAGALAGFRQLAAIGHETASPAAKEAMERLEPKEQAFLAAFNTARTQAEKDLGKADASLVALDAAGKAWGRSEEIAKTRGEIAVQVKQAAAAFQQLGPNPNAQALNAFIAAHPAAPQAAQARVRLDQVAQAQRSRDEQIQTWRAAMQGGQTEQAWRIARALFASGGDLPPDLQVPVRIETIPPGVQVQIDGKPVGTTPCVIGLRPEQAGLDVQLTMDGWLPASRTVGDLVAEWRWQAGMSRTAHWQVNLGKPIGSLVPLPDGSVLALAGEVLHHLSSDGKPLWRTSVAMVDDLSDGAALHLHHQPVVLPDGTLLLGLPHKDLAVISAKGTIDTRLPTTAAVHGRPQIYTNDLLGGQQRLAFAADALYLGDLGMETGRIALPSPALSGPLVFSKGPDRVLAVATVQGQLVAFEESTKQRLWNFDLQATEIGQLIPLGADGAFALLDGSRIAAWRITPSGASLRWSSALPGPAVGEPILSGSQIWIAAGNTLLRLTSDGVATSLPLSGPAVTAVAAGGDLAAVGIRSSQVLLFRKGVLLWATRCESMPAAVACTGDQVVVGMADGTLATYAP